MRSIPPALLLLATACTSAAASPTVAPTEQEATTPAPSEPMPVVSVCLPREDGPPIAPTFLVHFGQRAELDMRHGDAHLALRALVLREGDGYRVRVRVAVDDETTDGEAEVELGTPTLLGDSDMIVQLDLRTEQELRERGAASAQLSTETGCRSAPATS